MSGAQQGAQFISPTSSVEQQPSAVPQPSGALTGVTNLSTAVQSTGLQAPPRHTMIVSSGGPVLQPAVAGKPPVRGQMQLPPMVQMNISQAQRLAQPGFDQTSQIR